MVDEEGSVEGSLTVTEERPKKNTQTLINPYGTTGLTPMENRETESQSEKTGSGSIFRKEQSEDFTQQYDTQKLYMGVQRHWLLVLLSMLACAGLGWYGMNYLTSQYKAEAVVLYQGNPQLEKVIPGTSLADISMSTAMDMIKIPQNFQAVKQILGLDISPKVLAAMTSVPTPRNESDLIKITVSGQNKNLVVDVANTLAKVSVKKSQDLFRIQLQKALQNYKGELQQIQNKLAKQIEEIEVFKQKNRYFEMTAEHSQVLDEISESRSKLQTSVFRYNSLLVEYENLKREAESLPERLAIGTIAGGSSSSYIQNRISSLEAALSQARAKYHENNPKIKLLQDELKQLRTRSQTEEADNVEVLQRYERNQLKDRLGIELMRMQGKVRSAQKMRQDMQKKVEELELQLESLPAMQMAFAKLLQGKEITEDQVKFLNNAVQTTQLMINVPRGSIDLYQLAEQAKPLKDSWWVDILPIIGTIFGFFIGIGFAILWEIQDPRFCTANQLGLYYNIPCLVEVPELRFFSPKNGEESTLFFIRNLTERTERIYGKSMDAGKTTSITLTSAVDDEGKSCFAYYLARYFQRLGDKTVLLELDYRKNPFTEKLTKAEVGLEEYLKGKAELTDILLPGEPDRLRISKRVLEMKELLKSKRMQELWSYLEQKYEMIIVDAPGIIKEDYAVNVASYSDVTLFVIGSINSKKKQVDDSLKELEQVGVKPQGLILNRIQPLYIDDERIKRETKQNRKRYFQSFFSWNK